MFQSLIQERQSWAKWLIFAIFFVTILLTLFFVSKVYASPSPELVTAQMQQNPVDNKPITLIDDKPTVIEVNITNITKLPINLTPELPEEKPKNISFYEKSIYNITYSVTHPFNDDIQSINSFNYYDDDDAYVSSKNEMNSLYDCSNYCNDIECVYSCVQNWLNTTDGVNCRDSASAFKTAFLASGVKGDYILYKAFIWDESKYNAHRFILLENSNGYYVLDPLWCKRDIDSCVVQHTKSFYEDKTSYNYRGFVYKIDRFY